MISFYGTRELGALLFVVLVHTVEPRLLEHDGSFTMANSNSFLSAYEVPSIAQENKYLGKFSYFIVKLYVVCTH